MATGTVHGGAFEIEEGGASTATTAGKVRLYKETGTNKIIERTSATQFYVSTTEDTATAVQIEAGTAGKILTADQMLLANHLRTKFHGFVAAVYDFTQHTGGTATYSLIRPDGVLGDVAYLPNKARCTNSYLYVVTTLLSGGAATVALGVATDHAAGLLAATAYTSFTAGTWMQLIPDTAIANFTTATTAQRNLIAAIAGAALTAGKFIIYSEYVTTP